MNIFNFIQNNYVLFAIGIVWFYLLRLLERSKLIYYKFIVGAIGLFGILLFYLKPRITIHLARLVTAIAGFMGEFFGACESYAKYGMLFVSSKTGYVSLYVDYECAGLIEILVFISLVFFFPLFKTKEKIWISTYGTLWILMSNVIRIISICFIIKYSGVESYYMAHTIIGRLIFYALTVFLYFSIFTKKQILRQKVGNFEYVTNN